MKIIISSNRNNLDKFLKHEKDSYCYISLSHRFLDIEELLREKNLKKIDPNSAIGNMDFAKEYINFIGNLNRDHNSIYWWATTMSYKGTFGSNLCKDIFNYYCIASIIKSQNSNYIILNDNPVFNYCVKSYCEGLGIECKLLESGKRNGVVVHLRRCLKSDIHFICDGWARKVLASFYLSTKIKRSLKKENSYYIIKTWIDEGSFLDDNIYNDLFFGRLQEYLKEKGKNFIILAGILTKYRDRIRKINKVKQDLIIPQEYFVRYFDYLKVIALNIIYRPKIAKPVSFLGFEVTDLVKECLSKDYENNEINKNLIYYYYIKGLLKKIKLHTFLFPFEGQSWERLSMLAIKSFSLPIKTIGYAHASLPPYLLSYFYSKEEGAIVPLPDKIITMGKETKDILEKSGNYNNETNLIEGCALRYEYVFKKNRIAWNKNGTILAALSMDMGYSLGLLKILCDMLAENNGFKVVLRSHPFTPLKAITRLYDLDLGHKFQISKSKSFKDDLMGSSLVVYVDSTTGLEALMCGVPVVHVDLKEPVSTDPLFRLNSLKWTVSDKNELSKVIDYINHIDNEEYLKKYNDALVYLKRYFYPVEEKYLKEFV